MLKSHWVIFQLHTTAMHCFLKIHRESSEILCIAIIGMSFNIYLFIPYVPKCIFNMLCLIPLVCNSFFSVLVGSYNRVLLCMVWGKKFYLWHPVSYARRNRLGNTSKLSLQWHNINNQNIDGMGFFLWTFTLNDRQWLWLKNYLYFLKTTILELLWIWPSDQGSSNLKFQSVLKYQE